jgi:hypothetical protein
MAALKVARFGTANEHPDWEIGPSRLHLRHRRPLRMLKRIEGADRDGRFEAVPGILHAALALYRAISTRRMPNSWRCRHDSRANERSVFAPNLGADEAVGIGTEQLAVDYYGIVRIGRQLGVVLQGMGPRERRRCHQSGEGDGGQCNLQGRLHDQPLSQSGSS